jgi:hypothetical protein
MALGDGFSRGAAYDYLAGLFHGPTREVITSPTAELADGVVAARDNERVFLTIINLGTTEVFIAPEKAASLIAGIRLSANGGGVAFNVVQDGPMCALEWHAISSVAAMQLMVIGARREAKS